MQPYYEKKWLMVSHDLISCEKMHSTRFYLNTCTPSSKDVQCSSLTLSLPAEWGTEEKPQAVLEKCRCLWKAK